jgi:hypothetical protein
MARPTDLVIRLGKLTDHSGAHCLFEFCWECLASQEEILKYDNSKHRSGCIWHPNNVKEEAAAVSTWKLVRGF